MALVITASERDILGFFSYVYLLHFLLLPLAFVDSNMWLGKLPP